jgi:hypothetical protein
MAQLKDLLVTGPARLIGAVNFNQIPKYNNINLALITDVEDVVGKSSDAAGTVTVYGAIALATNANTAAGNAQSKADNAYSLAEDKTTMSAVESKGYATTAQA